MKWAISSLSWPTRPAVPPLTTGAQQRAVLCDRRMTPFHPGVAACEQGLLRGMKTSSRFRRISLKKSKNRA